MIGVFCLDTKRTLYFDAKTPYEAMEKLIYYLNLSHKDPNAKIQLVGKGRHLTVIHNGKTYSVRNF